MSFSLHVITDRTHLMCFPDAKSWNSAEIILHPSSSCQNYLRFNICPLMRTTLRPYMGCVPWDTLHWSLSYSRGTPVSFLTTTGSCKLLHATGVYLVTSRSATKCCSVSSVSFSQPPPALHSNSLFQGWGTCGPPHVAMLQHDSSHHSWLFLHPSYPAPPC